MTAWQLIENTVVIMIGLASALLVLRQHAPGLWARLNWSSKSKQPRAVPPSCHTGNTKAESHCVGGCGGCGGGSGTPRSVRAQE